MESGGTSFSSNVQVSGGITISPGLVLQDTELDIVGERFISSEVGWCKLNSVTSTHKVSGFK